MKIKELRRRLFIVLFGLGLMGIGFFTGTGDIFNYIIIIIGVLIIYLGLTLPDKDNKKKKKRIKRK